MENTNDFDLGSEPIGEDFDPFADDSSEDAAEATETVGENAPVAQQPETATQAKAETSTEKKTEAKGTADADSYANKLPVFEYAGATENIEDLSKTFDELRIEKAADFPELEDGKRVSWSIEYGKVTKTVPDAKGTSIGKMKTTIETSTEFENSLKKRGADKNPTCKVKPRVTAQSKGTPPNAYKGVFATMEEAESAGKIISIVPARDGNVYEIRSTEMGKFITPISGSDLLSDIRAGFVPALPRIPAKLLYQVLAFFRHFVVKGEDKEALVNIYWDKYKQEYVIDAPDQVVTKVSVTSQISEKFNDDRYIHYMDIHSHNTMKAFFSAVDDNDEKATRLYSVVGKLNEPVPEIRTRISNGGKHHEIDPGVVFEHVDALFPISWKDRVHYENVFEKPLPKPISIYFMLWDRLKKAGKKNEAFTG